LSCEELVTNQVALHLLKKVVGTKDSETQVEQLRCAACNSVAFQQSKNEPLHEDDIRPLSASMKQAYTYTELKKAEEMQASESEDTNGSMPHLFILSENTSPNSSYDTNRSAPDLGNSFDEEPVSSRTSTPVVEHPVANPQDQALQQFEHLSH
jgi:hypothetical protein